MSCSCALKRWPASAAWFAAVVCLAFTSAAQQPNAPVELPIDEPSPTARDPRLADAKRLFQEGNALRKVGDCHGALARYLKSRELVASAANTLNAAYCMAQLERLDEALELYEQLLTTFSSTLQEDQRSLIGPAMRHLRRHVGSIDISANVNGSLVVDGRARGQLPLMSPIRVLPGEHTVRVIEDGYATSETAVHVGVGETATVDAQLTPLRAAGRLRVEEPSLVGAALFVDGAPVGELPWEGTLAPGPHWYFVRKGELGSAPGQVRVLQGQTANTGATVAPLGSKLVVLVDPASAQLEIGGVLVGQRRWEGRLPLGKHQLRVTEEGYLISERTIEVRPRPMADVMVRLTPDEQHPRWEKVVEGEPWAELLGGFAIATSLGSGAEASCAVAACEQNGMALGALMGLQGGYEFPIRLSLTAVGGYLSLTKVIVRQRDESFTARSSSSSATTQVATQYRLQDDLSFRGPFAAAGLGYRYPLGEFLSAEVQALVGAVFVSSRDAISGTGTAGGDPLPVVVNGSGAGVSGADLMVMPALGLRLRYGHLKARAGIAAAFFALEGPSSSAGPAVVTGGYCDRSVPTTIDCAPAESFASGEPAYGPFFMLMPALSAGYSF